MATHNKELTDSHPEQSMTFERLQSLYELTRRINSVDDLPELLEFIIDRALSLIDGHQGLLLLSNDYERKLQHVALTRALNSDSDTLKQTLEFASSIVVKDVLKQGTARLITDLHADHHFTSFMNGEGKKFRNIRSVLAVPLKASEQLVGLIYIDHPHPAKFGPNELDFLNAFAGQAAFAIHRTQQHLNQIQDLTRLNELSRSIVQVLDLNEVLTRIVYEATRMLNVETGSVLLLDESELTFSTSVSKGKRVDIHTRLHINEGIAGWVVAQSETACINDVGADDRWFGEVSDGFHTRSLLCVPLQLNDRVIGALQVLNKKDEQGFKKSDIKLLSAFASSATIAIENARLFEEARQVQRLRTLNEASLALSSTLDLNKILRIGLDKSLTMLGVESGAIHLLNNKPISSGLIPQVNQSTSFTTHLTPRQSNVLAQFATVMMKQPANDRFLLIDQTHPNHWLKETDLNSLGIEALAIVPIEVGTMVKGGLGIVNTHPHTYSTDEINLLASMGRIIGLAVQNAGHYNKIHVQAFQLSYLNEVGSALTRSLDTSHIIKVITEGVEAALETENIAIYLIDSQSQEINLRYGVGQASKKGLATLQEEIATKVITHKQPIVLNGASNADSLIREMMLQIGCQHCSILCVPLIIEERVIGVVQAVSEENDRPFTNADQSLLLKLTSWAAIALHNAQLYDERVKAYQRLATEQKRRVAAETRGAMATIVLDMAHTMNNVVGAIRVWASKLEFISVTSPKVPLKQYRKELTQIRQNAEEAIKLISSMTGPLDMVLIGPTDLQDCLHKAIQSCWWPDNVERQTHFRAKLPLVRANAKRLETVFHNLLSNATQVLTHTGGIITIETSRTNDGSVQISIADNGPGISEDLQSIMFNPGISGKDGGLGLGLWLVETFIQQFDGRIEHRSSPQGTTFTVTLQQAGKNRFKAERTRDPVSPYLKN
ncbi:GAF domain-containing protein [Anaerolineales bacterium HSG6]|nr:GAF domain-containing protein [Anaerolineales bacterium HSG6]